jgi:hypothetical protein
MELELAAAVVKADGLAITKTVSLACEFVAANSAANPAKAPEMPSNFFIVSRLAAESASEISSHRAISLANCGELTLPPQQTEQVL